MNLMTQLVQKKKIKITSQQFEGAAPPNVLYLQH